MIISKIMNELELTTAAAIAVHNYIKEIGCTLDEGIAIVQQILDSPMGSDFSISEESIFDETLLYGEDSKFFIVE